MQKQCTRCGVTKTVDQFTTRKLSKDGLSAACTACLRERKRIDYTLNPQPTIARVTRNKQERFQREPGYRRAFDLWGTTKRRTKIPACMKITDFVPVCRLADRKGPEYELDHIVPLRGNPRVCGLHVPWNLRVVKRKTNWKKGSKFKTDWE